MITNQRKWMFYVVFYFILLSKKKRNKQNKGKYLK